MANAMMPRRARVGAQLIGLGSPFLIVAVAITSLQCSDPGAVAPADVVLDPTPIKGMVISNPHASATRAAIGENRALTSAADEIAYVSLAPKTLPNASRIQIQNRNRDFPASLVSVVDGGFDPVMIQANAHDSLDLVAWNIDGTTQPMDARVPARRPPSVVRTKPSKGLTDVALNVVITVVFTEPVDPKTLNTSSVQLLRGGSAVSGKITFQDNSWDAQFVADSPLNPNSAYEVRVTQAVRDLDGEALDAPFSSTFVTGTKLCAESLEKSGCPPPTADTRTIRGTVIERSGDDVQPVSNARVSAWVQLNDGSGYSPATVQADETGKFTISSLPSAAVRLHATAAGYDQPCGVEVLLSGATANADIEVVSTRTPLADITSPAPRLRGWVYELVPDPDRQNLPLLAVTVPGARMYVEAPRDFVVATTTGDSKGNYLFCNLPMNSDITTYAVKAGFTMAKQPPPLVLTVFGTFGRDVELKR